MCIYFVNIINIPPCYFFFKIEKLDLILNYLGFSSGIWNWKLEVFGHKCLILKILWSSPESQQFKYGRERSDPATVSQASRHCVSACKVSMDFPWSVLVSLSYSPANTGKSDLAGQEMFKFCFARHSFHLSSVSALNFVKISGTTLWWCLKTEITTVDWLFKTIEA